MIRLKTTKEFLFLEAEYLLSDHMGSNLVMRLDYDDKDFKLKVLREGKGIKKLIKEASLVARDLLERKSNINFAKYENI